MRTALVTLIALVALAVAACGEGDDTPAMPPTAEPGLPGTPPPPDDDPTPTPTPTPRPTPEPAEPAPPDDDIALDEQCDNEEEGYSVAYPEGWHTNQGDVAPPCTFFSPEEFEVPHAQDFTTDISIHHEPVNIDDILEGLMVDEVHEEEEVTIDGHDAVRIEIELVEDRIHPIGTRITYYLVDLDGDTLRAATYDIEDRDYDMNRAILDAMAETIEIH